jgi:hypothetical protein
MLPFGHIEYDRAYQKMANIANILPILVTFCKDIKNILSVIFFGSFTFKRPIFFMLWHTSDVPKHHHFSLQAGMTAETDLSSHINNPNHFQHH